MSDQRSDLQEKQGGDSLQSYAPPVPSADIYGSATPDMQRIWEDCADALKAQARGNLSTLQSYIDRQVEDIGLAFRMTGDEEERPWPLNPMPLILSTGEWSHIERGLAQRAGLLEMLVSDIYGPQRLVEDGHLPAAIISGSPHFARHMIGMMPTGGHAINICAFDLARGPDGEWRVLADRVRLPVGIGYALENRLAITRATGNLVGRIGARRHNDFFESLRRGLSANCHRADPRLALLTPGQFNQTYPEQAYLARYLGLALVNGRDLVVRDGLLYVRTVAGLKRIDGLWRWIDTRDIDPLHFDTTSQIGVPNLVEAASNGLVVANWLGAGVVEAQALSAFLPKLSRHLLGEELAIPNVATWWCGGKAERQYVLDNMEKLLIHSNASTASAGADDEDSIIGANLSADERAELIERIGRRPIDYSAQQVINLSTMPTVANGRFEARSFTLRVFMARDGDGKWTALPGGFARISESGQVRTSLMGMGDNSVDIWVIDPTHDSAQDPPKMPATKVRREEGLLPAQAADNLYWLGRYGERLNNTARVIRTLVSQYSAADAWLKAGTATARLANLLRSWGAAPPESIGWLPSELAAKAVTDDAQSGSVRHIAKLSKDVALLLRDRLPRDTWRTLQRPFPDIGKGGPEELVYACNLLIERHAAFIQLASDGMSQRTGWRFLDMGLALERASLAIQAVRAIVPGSASADDLSALLDLFDCLNVYRNRYLSIPTIAPVMDMVLLEPNLPRGFAYQIERIGHHLAKLPPLRQDGLPEKAIVLARALYTRVEGMSAADITPASLDELQSAINQLSDVISRTYFLQMGANKAPSTRLLG